MCDTPWSVSRPRPETRVVHLRGDLRAGDTSGLRQVLMEQVDDATAATVICDVSGLPAIDSDTLACLLAAYLRAESGHTTFGVRGAHGHVARVLERTGTTDVLTAGVASSAGYSRHQRAGRDGVGAVCG